MSLFRIAKSNKILQCFQVNISINFIHRPYASLIDSKNSNYLKKYKFRHHIAFINGAEQSRRINSAFKIFLIEATFEVRP